MSTSAQEMNLISSKGLCMLPFQQMHPMLMAYVPQRTRSYTHNEAWTLNSGCNQQEG